TSRRSIHCTINSRPAGQVRRPRGDVYSDDVAQVGPRLTKELTITASQIQDGLAQGVSLIGGNLPPPPDNHRWNAGINFAHFLVAGGYVTGREEHLFHREILHLLDRE